MYVGRIVAIGCTLEGRGAAMYRVSSRHFPNRQSVILDKAIAIVPKPGFENDIKRNPYIAYNCLRIANGYAIATNGSQTDPVTEKIESGMPPRDALAYTMLSMDYEHDDLDTPRISAVVSPNGHHGYLAIVRKDALLVREYQMKPGQAFYVCTYERDEPCLAQIDENFTAKNPQDACQFMMSGGVFADFEKPVSAACAVADAMGEFKTAIA